MKVRCDRGEMLEKLAVITGIVPATSPKPILYDFLLRTEGGSLIVEANDLEVAGRVQIERVEVMEEGRLALPAGRLVSILKEVPDGTSGVSLEANPEIQGATLRADGYEFKLFGHDPEEFPVLGDLQPGRSLLVPREPFVHSLRR